MENKTKLLFDVHCQGQYLSNRSEIEKEPALLEPYFKDFETNKRLLKFTDDVLRYYFSRSRTYLEQNDIPTWHNFFSRHVWNESLRADFKSFVVDNKTELHEIQKSFKSFS